ncbi:MAG: transcription elongation factor GreB [Gammaproteobacteria bacterium]|jgi:transcription elongation factor GreB
MSRWKKPQEKSSPYITPEGFQKLKNEYDSIWKLRAEVTVALSAAAAEGDRSENAEYIYRKKELGKLDYRIRYLQLRLQELNIVKDIGDKEYVFFGAKVTVKEPNGDEYTFRIVGSDELTSEDSNISVDSPLARALIGKTFQDIISYQLQSKIKTYIIKDIQYS